MSLTLGLAGMDPATEAALKAAFAEANERLSSCWRLLPETQADNILVDMDSMYGPMSWLRLHASGKRVIGLTSAARAQTDFRLARPFSADSVLALLREVAGDAAPAADPVSGSAAAAAPEAEATTPVAAATPAPPSTPEPEAAPAAATVSPAAPAAPVPATPAKAPPPVPVEAPTSAPPANDPLPAAATTDPAAPRGLFDWLTGGQLQGRLRYRRPSGPTLLIDTDARSYHGPAALKPLTQYFEDEVAMADFEPLEPATWAQEAAAAGSAQPLSRLIWLGGLCVGKGQLLPGLDTGGKYQLNRWPQIEREFPRHFRIATAMMKGPAVLAEVAEASGIALEEIVDFVNASLATGVAEPVAEQPVQPASPQKSSGLLGRLRGR